MGFHMCHMCRGQAGSLANKFPCTSSGDVTLRFRNGHVWQMPDMILHYVVDHGWKPPIEFQTDLLVQDVMSGERLQTRAIKAREEPTRVGYLTEPIEREYVSTRVIFMLERCMEYATKYGDRLQTKGR